jgi:hypothetical protein
VTVHDHPDTPSAISLKRASTIAEIRSNYGQNAKLLFTTSLKLDARCAGLYLHPKHKRMRRKPRIVSSI